MEKYLMLTATNQNWSLACVGMWGSTNWRIYSDGSYEVITGRIPERDPKDFSTACGFMNSEDFSALRSACRGKWKDPSICSDACDGEAWQIRMYSPSGRTTKTTGRLGYIYGQTKIEQIIAALPKEQLVNDLW